MDAEGHGPSARLRVTCPLRGKGEGAAVREDAGAQASRDGRVPCIPGSAHRTQRLAVLLQAKL